MRSSVRSAAIPPCSRCRRPASPEGAAVPGSMARDLMPTRLQHCPPRSTPSPAMAARLRPAGCPPRFLQGVIVRGGSWEKPGGGRTRLLLSTDPALSAPVEAYSNRWSIEIDQTWCLSRFSGGKGGWQDRRPAMPGGRDCPDLLQGGDIGCIGVHELGRLAAGFD